MNDQKVDPISMTINVGNLISWNKLIFYLSFLFILFSIIMYNFPSTSWTLPLIALISSLSFSVLCSNISKSQIYKNLILLPFSLVIALYILVTPFLFFSFFKNINFLQIVLLYSPCLIYVLSFKIFNFINLQNKKESDFINSLFIYCILVM